MEANFLPYIIIGGNYQFYLELLIPFLVLTFNIKRERFWYLRFLGAICIGFPLYFLPDLTFLTINFSYIICDIFVFLVGIFLIKGHIGRTGIYSIAAFAFQHFAWNFVWIILDLFPNPELITGIGLTISYIAIFVFLNAILFALIQLRKFEISEEMINKPFIFIIAVIIIVITFILSQKVSSWNIIYRIYTALCALISLALLFIFPLYLNNLQKSSKLQNEVDVMNSLIVQQGHQNELQAEIREITNIRIHDIKHQLENLEIYNNEETKNYIKSLKSQIDLYEDFATTGYETVDIILTEKSLLCRSKKITFTYIVDGDSLRFIDKFDVVSLLGNLLDNSIEASEKEEEKYRVIKLIIKEINSIISINITNYCHSIEHFDTHNYKSSKVDPFHGYGIKSIKYVAKKYGGSVDFKLTNNLFNVTLLLPLPEKKQNKSENLPNKS